MTGLERRYRRLLLAYPRRYRRTRGLEMLTTLMDASEPGQRRPAWRDAVNLIAAGLRCRFALPGGRWVATGVVFVALAAAGLGAAGGAWLGSRGAPDLPAWETLPGAANEFGPVPRDSGMSTIQIWAVERDPYPNGNRVPWVPIRMLGGDSNGNTTDPYADWFPATPTVALGQSGDRLLAGGWCVDPVRTIGHHAVLTARRGGITMIVAARWDPPHGSLVSFAFQRAEPGPVLPWTIIGAVLFGVLGWLSAAALARRMMSRAHGRQPVFVAAAIPAVGLLLPTTLATWLILVTGHPVDPARFPSPPAWAAYATGLGRLTTTMGAVFALVLVVLVLASPTARTYSPGRAP